MRALVVALLAIAGAALARAHEGQQHLMGTVTSVAGERLVMRTTDGHSATVRLGTGTRFERRGAAARPAEIAVGTRVVVEVEKSGDEWIARRVRLGIVAPVDARAARSASRAAAGGHEGHGTAAPAAPDHRRGGRPARQSVAGAAHAGHRTGSRGGSPPPPHAPHPAPPPAPEAAPLAGAAQAAHAGHQAETGPPAAAPSSEGPPPGPPDAAHAGHMPATPQAGHPAPAEGGPSPAMPGHGAGMPGHAMGAQEAGPRLFESDMTRMAGMTPRDPMAGMDRPGWQWMTMGIVRAGYNHQGGPSGVSAVESVNWSMVMAQRPLGRGRLTLMSMNSLEAATFPDGGSPQLFQTGETFDGRPIVDRQHPHDFFMNLSATYRAPFGRDGAYWLQVAPRGEPALGPPAFMHRASAGENPTATLGHHLQDSTHITDNVITAGLGWGRVALEGSVFHGEEPDEGRWDLDPGGLDSVSGRLRVDLWQGWSAQVSHGFLHDPEALEPGDLRRTTASLHYGAAAEGPFAATLLWGRNREEHGTFDSVLLEAAYQLTRTDHFYARAEHADKEIHLLETKGLAEEGPARPRGEAPHEEGSAAEPGDDIVGIRALTLGYLKDLRIFKTVSTGLGADLTFYQFPGRLQPTYGEAPLSFRAFVRLRWDRGHGGAGHRMQH